MKLPNLVSVCCLSFSAVAQTTWVVNPGGGPGVNFTDLPAAVAAATDGDTIRVQWGPFLTGVTGFSTNKGLTIVGEGRVFLSTASTPVILNGLPAGRQFRLVGFEAPRGQAMRIDVQNCAGEVHLEDLHALEPGAISPALPSIQIGNCALVTMRDVEGFGSPALQVVNSTAVLATCRLGVTSLGLGGGAALEAIDSVVDLGEPQMRTELGAPCITTLRTQLRIGGSAAAYIVGGFPALNHPGTAIQATLGSVIVDPMVSVQSTPVSAPPIVGSAVVATRFLPANWCDQAIAGQIVSLTATQPANSTLLQFVGLPGPASLTPFGATLLLSAPAPLTLVAVVVSPVAGSAVTAVAIPSGLPAGLAFAAQSLVIHGGGIELGIPVQFVTH